MVKVHIYMYSPSEPLGQFQANVAQKTILCYIDSNSNMTMPFGILINNQRAGIILALLKPLYS